MLDVGIFAWVLRSVPGAGVVLASFVVFSRDIVNRVARVYHGERDGACPRCASIPRHTIFSFPIPACA